MCTLLWRLLELKSGHYSIWVAGVEGRSVSQQIGYMSESSDVPRLIGRAGLSQEFTVITPSAQVHSRCLRPRGRRHAGARGCP